MSNGQIATVKFVLVGPNAGKSVKLGSTLNPYVFVDGVMEVTEDVGTVAGIANALKNFYSAYPEAEAEKAQERWDKEQAALKGGAKTSAAKEDDGDDDKASGGKKPGGKK